MAFSHWNAALTLDSNAGALTLLLLTVPAEDLILEKGTNLQRKEFPSEKELRRKATNTVVGNI